jgi:epoxyqueuosine reductase QueG
VVDAFQTPLDAQTIKAKALELGADLVGIADGQVMDENPPDPRDPRRPCDITELDGGRVIVLAKRYTSGTTRIARWDERHKYYNDEITLTMLEEASLELVFWLENNGYPAIIIPPTHTDPWRYMNDPGQHMTTLLSLNHAAVEAGLGTLGLNLQLLTPEYGPRVMLTAVLCSVDCETDERMVDALCRGPQCGRCLSTCPGDVVGHWTRDWPGCDRYRSPHGFAQLTDHLGNIFDADSVEEKLRLVRSEDSFNLWQSILRGSGVITGCRRCQDVCPVGEDYAKFLEDALAEIPEDTPEKSKRLATMASAESEHGPGEDYDAQARWIGRLGYLDTDGGDAA